MIRSVFPKHLEWLLDFRNTPFTDRELREELLSNPNYRRRLFWLKPELVIPGRIGSVITATRDELHLEAAEAEREIGVRVGELRKQYPLLLITWGYTGGCYPTFEDRSWSVGWRPWLSLRVPRTKRFLGGYETQNLPIMVQNWKSVVADVLAKEAK